MFKIKIKFLTHESLITWQNKANSCALTYVTPVMSIVPERCLVLILILGSKNALNKFDLTIVERAPIIVKIFDTVSLKIAECLCYWNLYLC